MYIHCLRAAAQSAGCVSVDDAVEDVSRKDELNFLTFLYTSIHQSLSDYIMSVIHLQNCLPSVL